MLRKAKAAVFVSGGGTNLQAIMDKRGSVIKSGDISLVISNKKEAFALKRAKKAGIDAFYLPYDRNNTDVFESEAEKLLKKYGIDVIVLAGFTAILSAEFVGKYDKRIINVHPALIPSFCGKGFYGLKVHEAALKYGVKVTGATVHYVNAVPDGGEIIMQKAVDILPGDTPETLQRRVMEQAEWILLPEALERVFRKINAEKGMQTETESKNMNTDGNENRPETIGENFSGNTYPGRGIIIGSLADGKRFFAYFIMGRSENSRNRIFEKTADGIRTKAFDETKCVDPSLIIYSPVRMAGELTIVTNGDQTDTVFDALKKGETFEDALMAREFEPDAPNFTPRISGIINKNAYKLSILKSEDGKGTFCQRNFYNYDFERGIAHLIHTYEHDGSPIPSFKGDPKRISVNTDCVENLASEIWNALDKNNRVSLYVKCVDDGRDVIINKNLL